jgi:YggT family protein
MPLLLLIVDWGIRAIMALIVVASLLTWFQHDPRKPVVKLLNAIVEPLLHPIRALLPPLEGMDFSPAVAILILYLLQTMIRRSIAP